MYEVNSDKLETAKLLKLLRFLLKRVRPSFVLLYNVITFAWRPSVIKLSIISHKSEWKCNVIIKVFFCFIEPKTLSTMAVCMCDELQALSRVRDGLFSRPSLSLWNWKASFLYTHIDKDRKLSTFTIKYFESIINYLFRRSSSLFLQIYREWMLTFPNSSIVPNHWLTILLFNTPDFRLINSGVDPKSKFWFNETVTMINNLMNREQLLKHSIQIPKKLMLIRFIFHILHYGNFSPSYT